MFHGHSLEDPTCPLSAGAEETPFKEPLEEAYRRWQRKRDHILMEGYNLIERWECQHNHARQHDETLKAFLETQYKTRPKEQLALRKGLRGMVSLSFSSPNEPCIIEYHFFFRRPH